MTTGALPQNARGVGIAGTAIAHGALIAVVLVAAHRGAGTHALVYEVNLVAAPLPSAAAKGADAPTKAAPRPVAPPVKPKATKPAPTKPPVATKHADAAVTAKPTVTPAEGVKPSTGQNVVTLHQVGVVFPYPEYLNNIEDKIYNRWNHTMFRPGLETRIAFVISKDGSVPAASYVVEKSSGSTPFDEAARAAIESVVAHREFGPLPDGFNGPSLSILFVFTQGGAGTQ